MSTLLVVVALVAVERLVELIYAAYNTRRLLARGGVEVGRSHYPLIVLLHAAWLAAILWWVPLDRAPQWSWLSLFILMQAARIWVLASLGPYWTTRVITVPGAPLVRRGPYRWIRHPNYLVVCIELVTLPLAFGAWPVALAFTLANATILAWRIRVEEQVLAPRRHG